VNNVKHKNPSCWERCPQPGNSSSVCWVECLFNTLLGNSTAGLPAVRPFLSLTTNTPISLASSPLHWPKRIS